MSKWFTATAALIALYGAYLWAFPTAVVRFRLTANVEVDGKIHSGSSVYEIRFRRPMIPLGMPYESSFRGEAVVVNLGQRGILFVLLKGAKGGGSGYTKLLPERVLAHRAKHIPWPVDGDRMKIYHKLSTENWSVDLEPDELPMMVRLRDLRDPRTVERVDPRVLTDVLGGSARLIGIRIERVDSGIWPLNIAGLSGVPVNKELGAVLPWLGTDSAGGYLGGRGDPTGLFLVRSDFSTGGSKWH